MLRIESLKQQRQIAHLNKEYEYSVCRPWGIYDRTYREYDTHFDIVLPPNGMRGLIKGYGKNPAVFDCCGPLSVLTSLHCDKIQFNGCALTLVDKRTPEKRKIHNEKHPNLHLLEGDLLNSKEWLPKVRELLDSWSKKGFDVITFYPGGGLENDKEQLQPLDPLLIGYLITSRL